MSNSKLYPEPRKGQGLQHVSAFEQGEFLRNVHLTGLAEHAEALVKDGYFTDAWRDWFASTAALARSLAEDGN